MREMLTTVPATLKSEPPGGDSTGIKGLASEVYLGLERMISEHFKTKSVPRNNNKAGRNFLY